MADWKKELINIRDQIRTSINFLQIVEQQIQNLIDGLESEPDKIPEAVEFYIKSVMSDFGRQFQTNISDEIGSINNQINEIKSYQRIDRSEISQLPSKSSPLSTNQKAVLGTAKLSASVLIRQMVELYNENINYFSNSYQIFELDATQESIEMIRTKSNTPIILSRTSTRGKFWGLEENGDGYLLPNPRQLFNEHNLDVVRVLFVDSNYYDGYRKIYLESPAKIASLKSIDNPAWQLIEKGIISFV